MSVTLESVEREGERLAILHDASSRLKPEERLDRAVLRSYSIKPTRALADILDARFESRGMLNVANTC
jgi:hypothetical protein